MNFFFRLSVTVLFIVVFVNVGYTQKEVSNWYFGWQAGIKFEDDTVFAVLDGKTSDVGATSSISDKDGNLLLYTDGENVYDRAHNQMANGTKLRGNPTGSIQAALIVPNPSDNGIYYVFCTNTNTGRYGEDEHLAVSVVDLSKNGGLGDVTVKAKPLAYPVNSSLLAATRHQNGKDVWVVVTEKGFSNFLSFLITAAGVQEMPVVSAQGVHRNFFVSKQMKISPDGSMIAVTSESYSPNGPVNTLELFNFNATTGEVMDRIFSIDSNYPYHSSLRNLVGVEFSPNNRFLYVTNEDSAGSDILYQFDLESGTEAAILASITFIGYSHYGIQEWMQLGPDGKIYIVHGGGGDLEYLSRIAHPNNKGVACGHEQLKISLQGRSVLVFTPIFISSFFNEPPSIEASPMCVATPVDFNAYSLGRYDSVSWDFDDPISGSLNKAKTKITSHLFSKAGTYHVTLTGYYPGGQTKILTKDITLKPFPVLSLADTTICSGTTVRVGLLGYDSYQWSTGATTGTIDVSDQGTYTVTVSNGQCTASGDIEITVLETPKVNLPDETITCDAKVILDAGGDLFIIAWSTGESTKAITVDEAGTYRVRVSNGKCFSEDSTDVIFKGLHDLLATVSDDTLGYDMSAQFDAQGTEITKWTWDFGDGSYSNEQYVEHRYTNAGNYEAQVTAVNASGCEQSVVLKIVVSPFLFIPNVFTPNADGRNDQFEIQYNGDEPYNLRIYDRWGKQVFQSSNKSDTWTAVGYGTGIFFYGLSIGTNTYKGWVQVLR